MIRLSVLFCLLLSFAPSRAESIWERRNPYFTNFNEDMRPRKTGDLLTLFILENTGFDAQEKREMEKDTAAGLGFHWSGSGSVGKNPIKKFATDYDSSSTSNRKFDGKANSTIERKFIDRMTVMVVGVMPNGNLIIDGCRYRQIGREMRTLRVQGVVRPADVGIYNTIESQYVANFNVFYEGRGPETNFTNQGWGGRLMNIFWPH